MNQTKINNKYNIINANNNKKTMIKNILDIK
jgi:hypothetical protein